MYSWWSVLANTIKRQHTHLYWLNNCIQTYVLNTNVSKLSCLVPVYPRTRLPAKLRVNVTASWYMDWTIIIFHIVRLTRGADFGLGFLSRILGGGGSVASAMAANVSIIRFTQSNCTGVNIDSSWSLVIAETKVRTTAVILTVSWNLIVS